MNSKLHNFLVFFFVVMVAVAAHLATASRSLMPGTAISENSAAHLFVPVATHSPTAEDVASCPELVNQAAHGALPANLPSPATANSRPGFPNLDQPSLKPAAASASSTPPPTEWK